MAELEAAGMPVLADREKAWEAWKGWRVNDDEVKNGKKEKGFAWVWMERVDPKKPRVANPGVVALRVADEGDKSALLAASTKKFFTEEHYNGFPAILVRLKAIGVRELGELIVDAWRCQAPRRLVEAFDNGTDR